MLTPTSLFCYFTGSPLHLKWGQIIAKRQSFNFPAKLKFQFCCCILVFFIAFVFLVILYFFLFCFYLVVFFALLSFVLVYLLFGDYLSYLSLNWLAISVFIFIFLFASEKTLSGFPEKINSILRYMSFLVYCYLISPISELEVVYLYF